MFSDQLFRELTQTGGFSVSRLAIVAGNSSSDVSALSAVVEGSAVLCCPGNIKVSDSPQ